MIAAVCGRSGGDHKQGMPRVSDVATVGPADPMIGDGSRAVGGRDEGSAIRMYLRNAEFRGDRQNVKYRRDGVVGEYTMGALVVIEELLRLPPGEIQLDVSIWDDEYEQEASLWSGSAVEMAKDLANGEFSELLVLEREGSLADVMVTANKGGVDLMPLAIGQGGEMDNGELPPTYYLDVLLFHLGAGGRPELY